ncbi:5-hydroxytryptamine receptor-like isoform X2 [Toxorhynchites rutilus septentrionalis]|uniref:5-hydroxytryptamine receptor-like isoform X2 n=1 Tax=Toxorhynchites rutilus septentrionalis TaxID=329112 RepID=UPI002479D053|nr:5-hydroxytryptamine receptor-like isoform X2 [Toxorhynchites rutilus septentrionalis]
MATSSGHVTETSFPWPSWPWSSPARAVSEKVQSRYSSSPTSGVVHSMSTTSRIWSSPPSSDVAVGPPQTSTRVSTVRGFSDDFGIVESTSGSEIFSGESERGYGSSNGDFLEELIHSGSYNGTGNGSNSSELFGGTFSNFSGASPVGPVTSSLFANYTTEFSIDVNISTNSGDAAIAAGNSRSAFSSLPDLLAEDELMALWNCTNCFLLNYSGSSSSSISGSSSGLINGTISGRFGNGTDRDLLLSRAGGSGYGATGLDEDAEATIYLIRVIATAIILGIVILATVIGNVFVIAAILLERNLQSVANHLILSLAVADLLVACLVMPLGAVYEVSKEWRLGADLCDMWTSSDVLCCTASILHLVAIALDRYWAVTNIDYAHQRTARRIGYMIIVIWTLSVLVSIAPLLGWKDPMWETRVYEDLQCIVSQDVGYQIFATASSFYVPLLVILFLYWRIFLAARKRIRRRQQGKTIVQLIPKSLVTASQPNTIGGPTANVVGGSGGIAAAVVAVIGRPLPTISETTTAFTNVSSANTSPEKGSLGNGIERDRIEVDPPTADISMAYPSHSGACSTMKPSIMKKKSQTATDSKRERKAAKTLAIITGAFVCCWLPFFIIAILLPTCTGCDFSPIMISVCLWLGYFNSTLNPIIYTIFSPEFRHAFKRILCGRRNSLRRTRHVRHMRVYSTIHNTESPEISQLPNASPRISQCRLSLDFGVRNKTHPHSLFTVLYTNTHKK